MTNVQFELEGEYEDEGEGEFESEYEAEDELEGEYEDEFEVELRNEFEDESEDFSVLGLGEEELEAEHEGEFEDFTPAGLGEGAFEDELELEGEVEGEAEEFFKIGKVLRRFAPALRQIAKVAGPMIATAVGGPAAGAIARAVTSQLEGELEDELEAEFEDLATAPLSTQQALGEYLAARAATAESESEAEGFIGSAVTLTLQRRDYRELQRVLPSMIKGTAVLTRALRRSRGRAGVRLIPGIVDASARTLARRQAVGGAVTPTDVGSVLAAAARRALSDPRVQRPIVRRHARGVATVGRGYPRGGTLTRRPSRVRTVSPTTRLQRPRPGYVRVATPVRVPARGTQPARTVRVLTDVRVPSGARLAGRPVGVNARR
ncbi:hypothetical protein [Rhodococcus kronopolitis]|uniref:DUF222 domain-containing protein n=1 Tax=Rhodococcus kronopolitis TaxID=1460226 RepID=A0ABV9FV10_9NOCA